MNQHQKTGRRSFVNWFLGTSLGALCVSVVYPVIRFVSPPNVPEATTNQVNAGLTTDPEMMEKKFKIVRFGADPVILIHAGEDDYRAFAATCTHLDCVVEYQDAQRRIWCNCHNGEYDLQGRNVAGPPPKPLEVFTVHVERKSPGAAGTIIVSRS
jgi:Rieske Fe-S protein